MGRKRLTPEQVDAAFWARVDKRGPDDCWLWIGAMLGSRVRYGAFAVHQRQWGAHRWAHERFIGPIPPEHEVEHRCHNGLCVNPRHLRAVTHADNERAKDAAGRRPTGVRDLPCPHCGGRQDGRGRRRDGREFAYCVPCRREYQRTYYQRRKMNR